MPVACHTAFAMAPTVPVMPISPTPLMPSPFTSVVLLDQQRFERRHVGIHRHVVFAKICIHDAAAAPVHARFFVQREGRAPDHAAIELAAHQPRVDDPPGREGADQARGADLAEIGVDLDLREDRSVRLQRMVADGRRIARALALPSISASPARARMSA